MIVDDAVQAVVELTERQWGSRCEALYAYGSYAGGGLDAWSDLDLLLIERGDEPVAFLRMWDDAVAGACALDVRVDSRVVRWEDIGTRGPWGLTPLVAGLKAQPRLLMGQEVRERIPEPCGRKLRVAVLGSAFNFVRSVCGIGRDVELPAFLASLALERVERSPLGNAAWHLGTTVVQLLRAIEFLEAGTLVHDKRKLAQVWGERGEQTMAVLAKVALGLRQRVGRTGLCEGGREFMNELAVAIPGLYERLSSAAERYALKDPSYRNGLWYDMQGHVKTACSGGPLPAEGW